MVKSEVELDFLSMEKDSTAHPEVLNAAISTGSANVVAAAAIDPSTPKADCPLLPVFNPTSRLCCGSENSTKIEPLAIFYDGTVAVFNVSGDEAEDILKFAERSKIMDAFSSKKQLFVEDLPLARRNSLLRFLEKRKERMKNMVSPNGNVFANKN